MSSRIRGSCRKGAVLLATLLLLVGGRAAAITQCTFSSVVGVDFGAYDTLAPLALETSGSLTFSCEGVGGAETVVITLGRGSAASYSPRTMLKGSTALSYNLYLDASRTTVWGDGSEGTSSYGPVHPAAGGQQTVTVYGRIPAQQNVSAGTYGDSIVATIHF